MTAPLAWIENTERELRHLLEQHQRAPLAGADAYRLLVLLGREDQLCAAEAVARNVTQLTPVERDALAELLAASCEPPEREGLIEELLDALDDGDEPAGPLLDVLLAIDDRCTVEELRRHEGEARELAESCAAAIATASDESVALSQWAAARIATMPERSAAAILWRAVQETVVWRALELIDHRASGEHALLALPVTMLLIVLAGTRSRVMHGLRRGTLKAADDEGLHTDAYDERIDPGSGELVVDFLVEADDTPRAEAQLAIAHRGQSHTWAFTADVHRIRSEQHVVTVRISPSDLARVAAEAQEHLGVAPDAAELVAWLSPIEREYGGRTDTRGDPRRTR